MDANGLLTESDSNFEPHCRTRSNTWPCHPAEDFVEAHNGSPASDEIKSEHPKDLSMILKQKTSSRRNAWGNLSYADLITKAIQGSPDQRLTLSQIYDWMVQNVPYFKDKGDNTSSAGWKNSIRHNLSLHSRFMRIQNEGTGKSSWWVINPDAKPGKAPRHRAESMETKSLEKKRGRVKKRIEAIRAGQENGSVSNEDLQDTHFKSFSVSPEFRTRAGSNASSGRLSPIQAAVEPNLHDEQVPPMSPIPWGTELDDDYEDSSKSFSLVDSLVGGLNIHEASTQGLPASSQCPSSGSNDIEMDSIGNSSIKRQLLSSGTFQFNATNGFDNFGNLPAPPSYNDHIQQQQSSQQMSILNLDTMSTQSGNFLNLSPNPMYQNNIQQQHQMTKSNNGTCALGINTQLSPVRSPQLSPSRYFPHHYISSPQPLKLSLQNITGQSQLNHVPMNQVQQPQQQTGNNCTDGRSLLQRCLEAPNDSMLRAALTQHLATTYQARPVHTAQLQEYERYNYLSAMSVNNHMLQSVTGHYVPNNQLSRGGQAAPAEGGSSLAEIDTNSMLDLDYDVEQLLRHELELDANLDFNFESHTSETKPIVW